MLQQIISFLEYWAKTEPSIYKKTLRMHFQLLTFLDLNMGQLESQMQ